MTETQDDGVAEVPVLSARDITVSFGGLRAL